MTIAVANVNLANTFSHWMARTNELAQAMSLNCVTVGGTAAVGNAVITGTFSANTLKIDTLSGYSGANVTLNSVVLVVSNTASLTTVGAVNINGAMNVGSISTIKIQGSNATHQVVSAVDANGTLGFVKVSFPLDQLSDVDTSNIVSKDNYTIMAWSTTANGWVANTLSLINSTRINTLNVGTVSSVLTVSANVNVGSNTFFVNTSNKRVGIGMTSPSAALSVNGAIIATGDISAFQTSDVSFKDNVVKINTKKALDVILSIDVSEFDWNSEKVGSSEYVGDFNKGHDVGLIAQQLLPLGIPGLVLTRPDGTLAVNYPKLIPYLVAAVQAPYEKAE